MPIQGFIKGHFNEQPQTTQHELQQVEGAQATPCLRLQAAPEETSLVAYFFFFNYYRLNHPSRGHLSTWIKGSLSSLPCVWSGKKDAWLSAQALPSLTVPDMGLAIQPLDLVRHHKKRTGQTPNIAALDGHHIETSLPPILHDFHQEVFIRKWLYAYHPVLISVGEGEKTGTLWPTRCQQNFQLGASKTSNQLVSDYTKIRRVGSQLTWDWGLVELTPLPHQAQLPPNQPKWVNRDWPSQPGCTKQVGATKYKQKLSAHILSPRVIHEPVLLLESTRMLIISLIYINKVEEIGAWQMLFWGKFCSIKKNHR